MKFCIFAYDTVLPSLHRMLNDEHTLKAVFTFPCDNIFNFNREIIALAQHLKVPVITSKAEDFHIQKFVKVKGKASPYNGNLTYWATRMGKSTELPTRVAKLLKKQSGKCTECGTYFRDEDVMEVDHILPRSQVGKDNYRNYQLLHRHCHDIKTKRDGTYDKSQIIEEPCDAKVSSTVLEPSYVGDSVA